MIESLCLYLLCLSAALLCYTGFQNYSLVRSISCSCSTCCFGLGFQHQNLQDFIKVIRELIKDIFLGAVCGFLPCPLFVAGASPPGVRVLSESWGSPWRQVRFAACAQAWRGGGGGGVSRPPVGLARGRGARGSLRLTPSLCLPWAGYNAGVIGDAQVTGGAAPILLRFVVACRLRAWFLRCPCALVWVRPPVATPAGAGGGGCGGARLAGPAAPPEGVAVPPGGGWTPPLPRGGWRAGAPAGRRRGGNWGGRGGGERRCPLPPWSRQVGTPPGYIRSAGAARQPLALGAAWPAAGGSVWRGGGGGGRGLFAAVCSLPPSPGGHQQAASPAHSWVPPFRRGPRRRRRAAGRQRVMRKCVGGRPGALGARLRSPLLWRPPLGWRGPLGGARGCRSSDRLGAGGRGGGGMGGRGGSPQSPPVPLAPPRHCRGGGGGASGPGGPAADWGGVPVPRPPPPSQRQAPLQVLAGASCPPGCRRVASAGRGGGGGVLVSAGGGSSGQRSAVTRAAG